MKSKYELKLAHLYGDLMNTYGDYGNVLVLRYYGRKMGVKIDANVISLDDQFNAKDYDMAILGDGQYFEQSIVAKNLSSKAAELKKFIDGGKPLLAVGEGYQLLGKYYVTLDGHQIDGAGVMGHHTFQKDDGQDFVGDFEIVDPVNHQHYHGFEHHQDQTFLGQDEKPLGKIVNNEADNVGGNNEKDNTEGAQYKNTYGTYIHSFLARNPNAAKAMLLEALKNKYPHDDFSRLEAMKFAPSY